MCENAGEIQKLCIECLFMVKNQYGCDKHAMIICVLDTSASEVSMTDSKNTVLRFGQCILLVLHHIIYFPQVHNELKMSLLDWAFIGSLLPELISVDNIWRNWCFYHVTDLKWFSALVSNFSDYPLYVCMYSV